MRDEAQGGGTTQGRPASCFHCGRATLAFVRERPALGFLAQGVARHFEGEGLLKVLPMTIPIELPPVGIITLRARVRTPAASLLVECLRQAAARMASA